MLACRRSGFLRLSLLSPHEVAVLRSRVTGKYVSVSFTGRFMKVVFDPHYLTVSSSPGRSHLIHLFEQSLRFIRDLVPHDDASGQPCGHRCGKSDQAFGIAGDVMTDPQTFWNPRRVTRSYLVELLENAW